MKYSHQEAQNVYSVSPVTLAAIDDYCLNPLIGEGLQNRNHLSCL